MGARRRVAAGGASGVARRGRRPIGVHRPPPAAPRRTPAPSRTPAGPHRAGARITHPRRARTEGHRRRGVPGLAATAAPVRRTGSRTARPAARDARTAGLADGARPGNGTGPESTASGRRRSCERCSGRSAWKRRPRCRSTAAGARLRAIPGVGPWTAAEALQRSNGDPDALTVGDLHLPGIVGYALTGRAGHRRRGDAGTAGALRGAAAPCCAADPAGGPHPGAPRTALPPLGHRPAVNFGREAAPLDVGGAARPTCGGTPFIPGATRRPALRRSRAPAGGTRVPSATRAEQRLTRSGESGRAPFTTGGRRATLALA